MSEPKLIKFDKSNPEHVANIKSGDFKIHSGGYFSSNKPVPLQKITMKTYPKGQLPKRLQPRVSLNQLLKL